MSTLAINTISGQTAANSVVVTGEGGTNTTSLQQGLAKAWVNFDGTGTIAVRDSFNVASLTDNATGNYTVNFMSAMSDANYSANSTSLNYFCTIPSQIEGGCNVLITYQTSLGGSLGYEDQAIVRVSTHGDLA